MGCRDLFLQPFFFEVFIGFNLCFIFKIKSQIFVVLIP